MAVLRTVDGHGRCSKNGNVVSVELHGEVVGDLASYADNDAVGAFQLYDVHDALEAELVEI